MNELVLWLTSIPSIGLVLIYASAGVAVFVGMSSKRKNFE